MDGADIILPTTLLYWCGGKEPGDKHVRWVRGDICGVCVSSVLHLDTMCIFLGHTDSCFKDWPEEARVPTTERAKGWVTMCIRSLNLNAPGEACSLTALKPFTISWGRQVYKQVRSLEGRGSVVRICTGGAQKRPST